MTTIADNLDVRGRPARRVPPSPPLQSSSRPNKPWRSPEERQTPPRAAGRLGGVSRRAHLSEPPGREPSWLEGRILVVMKPAHAASRRFLPGRHFNVLPVDLPVEQFTVLDQVTHDKYGLGRVVLVEDDDAVIVSFGSRKVRVLSPFVTLTKL